jgi:hypothetical protein
MGSLPIAKADAQRRRIHVPGIPAMIGDEGLCRGVDAMRHRLRLTGTYLPNMNVSKFEWKTRDKVGWLQRRRADENEDLNANRAQCIILTVIVNITNRDFEFMPSGPMNTEAGADMPHVEELTCTGGRPEYIGLGEDFTAAVENLRQLIDVGRTRGLAATGVLIRGPGNALRVKFRHVLFEVRLRAHAHVCLVSQEKGRGIRNKPDGRKDLG